MKINFVIQKIFVYLSIINNKTYIMNYQNFISKALKSVTVMPTKDQMEFAYVVLFQGLNLSVEQSINESIKL